MAIDRTGAYWQGSRPQDLDDYLTTFSAEGYPATTIGHSLCANCGGVEFRIRLDDNEGCAERTCVACGERVPLLDSADYLEDADLGDAACPCGGELFNVAIGFARYPDSEDIRWVYLGLRCVSDGILGCYADWKVDYSPSAHLIDAV